MLVSVIILDFLKAQKVVKNVQSIFAQEKNFDIEISVVDNSCNSKNAEILKNFEAQINEKRGLAPLFIEISEKNLGYTKGNNLAAEKISENSEYIFVINPDIEMKNPDTLQKMVSYLEDEKNKKVGILGPRQVNEDGTFAMNVRKFPNLFLQIIRRVSLRNIPFLQKKVEADEMQKMDKAKTQEVDWLQSSFFCIRKKLWDEIGGFNEEYFLFMADSEICLEAWKRGYTVEFFAETEVSADGIRCSAGGFKAFFTSWVLRQHLRDALKYMWKHIWEKNPRKQISSLKKN